jgi:flavin-dependent dehydrogenase
MRTDYDVLVIGGGPGGSTAAALLAEYGHDVLVLERDAYPRHHIGESLMPATYWVFERLGVLDKLRSSDFPRKESVQFVSDSGKDSLPYYFTDRDPSEWSTTWQVPRDKFDIMMLNNAREKGATVRQGASVKRVLFDGQRATGVEAEIDGKLTELRARVVVDASGQSSIIARQLQLRSGDPALRNAAIYSYYRGVRVDDGRNAGATIIIHTPERRGWFWFIPLPDNVASVGVVGPPAHLTTGRGGDPAKTLEDEIRDCPGILSRLEYAERIDEVRVCSDFTYMSTQIAGDGWVLVGDAFGFLDPVYSSGVMLALKGGELAADAIHAGLASGNLSGRQLGGFGAGFAAGIHLLKQLVYAFYDKQFSFGQFMKAHPEHQDHLVRLLIGDVFNDEVGSIFDAMGKWTNLPQAMRA